MGLLIYEQKYARMLEWAQIISQSVIIIKFTIGLRVWTSTKRVCQPNWIASPSNHASSVVVMLFCAFKLAWIFDFSPSICFLEAFNPFFLARQWVSWISGGL